jgi:Putative bacterial sensory transduction regulator
MSRRVARTVLFCTLFPLLCSLAHAQPKLQPRPAAPGPAPAQQAAPAAGLIDGIPQNMESVVPLIKAAPGFSNVEIVSGDNNYKAVRAQLNGTTVVVGPEVCKDGMCKGLVFFANLGKQQGIDLAWINAWNAQKVFSRAYQDKAGNIVFDLAIHFWGATSPRFITETADLYGVMLKALFEFQPGK